VPTYGAELLQTANSNLVRTPPPLAVEMLRRAGPSEGRWRMVFDTANARSFAIEDSRFRVAATLYRLLEPQFDALFVESTQTYFSLPDAGYIRAINEHAGNFARLFGVRFIGVLEERRSPEGWKRNPEFVKAADGVLLQEVEPGPRAFLVDRLFEPPPGLDPIDVFVKDEFSPRTFAVLGQQEAKVGHPVRPDGRAVGTADFTRRGPDAAEVETSAPGPRFLVVGEHFDAGWTATVDGRPSPVVAADGLALGLWLPPGDHHVLLRFRPAGFTAALVLACATAAALLGLGLRSTRRAAPLG
jgi:hypothetical protein